MGSEAQIGRTNVDRGGEHHATIHPTRQEIPRHPVLFLMSMHPLCRESMAQPAIEQDGYPSASILAPTRKVNIGAYCVQRDDTSKSWPTPPTDLQQCGRSVQKQHEQLFYCWSEGELGKGDRGSSTTTILAYNPMASCPRKLLPCSNSCTCWSFTVKAYEILDVADKRSRYNISITGYILFSKYVCKKIDLSRLVFMYRLPYENILRIGQISKQMAHSDHNYSKSIDRLFKTSSYLYIDLSSVQNPNGYVCSDFPHFTFFELK
ncbi:uncharacterized protein LOC125545293 isoform X2 [Triticum urartu]|uniref:uncharacterized protein LOC125545293 isoform X2 n=1 Tax=Triticum urartu TaxID=4572 RepID=UPI0020442AAA|nr:uncharacterized protein LOC125545293 isoform X2 [Triticum urartu]